MNGTLPTFQDQIIVFLQVVLAGFLGGLIGLERELAHKAAGLRTHMLVSASSALFVLIAPELATQFSSRVGALPTEPDPLRVIQAIITGIAFLGAGTIVFHAGKELVEGLTTAGSVLLTCGLGMTVGVGLWPLAIALTFLAFFVLRGLGFIEIRCGWVEAVTKGGEDSDVKPPKEPPR